MLRLILVCCLAVQPIGECRLPDCAPAGAACCCQSDSDEGQPACSCCGETGAAPSAPSPEAPDPGRFFSALPMTGGAIALPIPIRVVYIPAAPAEPGKTARDVRVKLCVWLT